MSIIEDYKVLVKNGTEKILSNGGEWNEWLKFAGNTYTYDVNNSIAIYMQNPKVTAAAELTEWNDYNRRVHKGQKGIMIYKACKIHLAGFCCYEREWNADYLQNKIFFFI